MKKLITALIALSMLLCCLSGLAEDAPEVFENTGVSMAFRDILDASRNHMEWGESSIVNRDPFVAFVYLDYYAMPETAMAELYEQYKGGDEQTREAIRNIVDSACCSLAIILVTDDAAPDAALEILFGEPGEGDEVVELGAVGAYRYFAVLPPLQAAAVQYDDFAAYGIDPQTVRMDEEALLADMSRARDAFVEALGTAELTGPLDPDAGLVGQTLRFETTDVDGNPVTSEALFRDNRITMVNLWGTWCGHCVDEMEELARIHTRLREKGCGVVGVEWEKEPIDTIVEDIHAFMEEKGMNYPSVLMPEENEILNGVDGYPTTFFVDSEGTILTYPIVGALVDQYEPTVEKLLADGEADAETDAGAEESDGGAYRVIVSDPDGNPVEGAMIQFCDDVTCAFQPTDAQGMARFSVEAQKVYEVHVLVAPEGYAPDETVYSTQDTFSDVNIVLERAE